jgi:hypothetical protein
MSAPGLSRWGVAKRQGTWLWTTHSEVRILPPQSGLPALTAMVLAVDTALSCRLSAGPGKASQSLIHVSGAVEPFLELLLATNMALTD